MHEIITRVVGVGNRNTDGTSRQNILKKLAQPGGEVILNHVRSEEGDLNTIEVLMPMGEGKEPRRVGFLPGRVGEKIARHLDAGRTVNAEIISHPIESDSDAMALHLKITY